MVVRRFVINLDRRPDRLSEFFSRFGSDFEVERVSAVDGRVRGLEKNLSVLERFIIDRGGYGVDMGRFGGTFGCWVSHVRLWDELAFSDAGAFVIFEDDAFPCKDFNNKLNFVVNSIGSDVDLVYFGGRFSPNFSPSDLNQHWGKVGVFYEVTGKSHGRNLDRTTHGYVITRNGAIKILDLLFKTKGKLPPLDGWLNYLRRASEIKALDFFPHLTHSPANYKSDIQLVRSPRT